MKRSISLNEENDLFEYADANTCCFFLQNLTCYDETMSSENYSCNSLLCNHFARVFPEQCGITNLGFLLPL